jgi:catalase
MAITKVFTNENGAPVADNTNIMTAGPRGPALLQDKSKPVAERALDVGGAEQAAPRRLHSRRLHASRRRTVPGFRSTSAAVLCPLVL